MEDLSTKLQLVSYILGSVLWKGAIISIYVCMQISLAMVHKEINLINILFHFFYF
jgi:hypothetical protein